jgi:hypothetical protein
MKGAAAEQCLRERIINDDLLADRLRLRIDDFSVRVYPARTERAGPSTPPTPQIEMPTSLVCGRWSIL